MSASDDLEKLLEIEAPHSREEPRPKILSSADFTLDTPPDIAMRSLAKILRETIVKNPKLRAASSLTLEDLNDSIMDVLMDMPTAKLVNYAEDFGVNDSELGITLPDDIIVKTDTGGGGNTTSSSLSHTKRKKIKKKPKKPKLALAQPPTEHAPKVPVKVVDLEETPQEVGVPTTPTSEPTSAPDATPDTVRDIDDIDDIEIGVSEDLLKGMGIGNAVSNDQTAVASTSASDAASKTSQSRVVAREKFRSCENCGSMIEERILVCSGCKKVAYCDRKCQKANWKAHKKTCSHKANKEDCTG